MKDKVLNTKAMAQSNVRIHTVLFKAEIEVNNDPYVEALKRLGVLASVIPVLSFEFVNEDVLQNILKNEKQYIGILFTSPRAVEAVKRAFNILQSDELLMEWRNKEHFCIGEATSKLVESELQFQSLGETSGNSEKLCDLIISRKKMHQGPFLFPCSNIRRETLPKTLSQNNIAVFEVIAYQTLCNSSLKELWENEIAKNSKPEILCYFSPSGVNYTYKLVHETYSSSHKPMCVAIGPTTAQAMREVGLEASVIAAKPNPTALCDAIKQLLKNQPVHLL